MFYVTDGNLQSEYQSGLNDARTKISKYSKVYINEINYPMHGTLFRVKPITLIIDSLIVPKMDTCWVQIPTSENIRTDITKDSFIQLINNSLGFNSCSKRITWPDSLSKARLLFYTYNPKNTYSYQPIKQFEILPNKFSAEFINQLERLNPNDLVEFRPLVYQNNGEYYAF